MPRYLDFSAIYGFACCLALVVAVGLAGCGNDTKRAPSKSTDTAGGDVGAADASAADADTSTEQDTKTDELDAVSTDAAKDAVDAGSPDAGASTSCITDQYCVTLYKGQLGGFQTAVCVDGTCAKLTKAGFCANDGDCDDGSQCTDDSCDLATNKCVSSAKPNCCAGKVSVLNARFEQKSMVGFVGTTNPSANNNVKWQLSTNRAHGGKVSLYLGNECNTFDSSMTAAGGCKEGPSKLAFEANLLSQEVVLPKNKPSIAHFWVWIEAEPMFDSTGSCANPCPTGATCVKVDNSTSVCIPEPDVLKIFVQTGAPSPDPVWVSTDLKKTTAGWVHVVINLAPYQKKGKATPLKLRWNFKSNNVKNSFEGVYIDDVVIETLCVTAGSQCTKKTPCADDKNGCTTDSCTFFANDGTQGLCFSDKTIGCCINVADCNDLNDCTVDTCSIASGADKGLCSNAPDAKNAQCCQPKDVYSDTFESGSIAAWNHLGSNSKEVKWQVSDKVGSGVGGGKSLYFGNTNVSKGYDDATLGANKGPKGRVCSPVLDIAQGTLYDVLTLDLMMQTEWSGKPAANYVNPPCPSGSCQPTKIDHLAIEVFSAGQYLQQWSSDAIKGTTEGKWLPTFVSLDKFQGKKVQICFSFDAGDGGGNTSGGIWIDNVKLAVQCTAKECSVDTQCEAKCGTCATAACGGDGQCMCTPIAGCCAKTADCADGDKCTNETCDKGVCKFALTSPTCCTDKIGKDAVFAQDWEASPKVPSDWAIQVPKGKNDLGLSYAKDKGWRISVKSKPGSGNYALYFGGKDGTLNAGTDVPAGTVTGPEFTVPKNGTTLINFDLYLNTEWDDFVFKTPPLAIDQLFVNVVDVAEKDPKKAVVPVWNSYAIEGSTKGKWADAVMAIPSSMAGKKVRLQFVFDCGTNTNNKGEGAFIDNLRVETLCTKPACVADTECQPQTPDACKKFWCGKDVKGAYGCQSEFKAGKGCCKSSVALPIESGESGSFVKWGGTPYTGQVKWQIISHKYLVGKKEIYFGNATDWNYAAGSAKVCAVNPDCPTGTGEKCTGAPGKKKCYKPVTAELISNPFDLAADPDKLAAFKFKAYLDLETNWETLEIWVSYLDQVAGKPVPKEQKLWEKTDIKDMPVTDYKKVIDKSIDLSPFKAKINIRVKFMFDSGDANGNEKFEGIFLDDLVVEETCK